MRALDLARPNGRLSVLCLGAHSDDIEIGAGGTILSWIASGVRVEVVWCVCGANGARRAEAEASAAAFLEGAATSKIELANFEDGFFPYQGAELKAWLKGLSTAVDPDVILTHQRSDAHQDHREVCQLTWNLFRDHLILEYEISQVGRGSESAERVCAAQRCGSGAQTRVPAPPFRDPTVQGLVRRRDLRRAGAPPRHGVPCPRALC